MPTKQPKWKFVGGIGDIDPIAHGGGFVYEDSTGVYEPEMEYFEPDSDETWHKLGGKTPLTVCRICIARNASKEWWYDKLDSIASYTGQSIEDIQRYANGSTMERAQLYADLISYFGAHEFDSYPTKTTEGKAYFRYHREMKKNRGAK